MALSMYIPGELGNLIRFGMKSDIEKEMFGEL